MVTLTREPKKITAGDTLTWSKSLSDYPANDGYMLHYILAGGGAMITIDAVAAGVDHLVNVAATVSSNYVPGDYSWFSYITKGVDRFTVDRGVLTIDPDPTKFVAGTDLRSHVKKFLDAIEAALEGVASSAQLSTEIDINGRKEKIEKVAPNDLIRARTFYLNEYKREQDAEKIAKGENLGGLILTRFDS